MKAAARSLRTRLGLDIVAKRVAGTDGLGDAKFNLAKPAGLHSTRTAILAPKLVRDDLVEGMQVVEEELACGGLCGA